MRGITGHHGRPATTASDGEPSQPQVELPRELLATAVALEAVGLEHGTDVLLERDRLGGQARKQGDCHKEQTGGLIHCVLRWEAGAALGGRLDFPLWRRAAFPSTDISGISPA